MSLSALGSRSRSMIQNFDRQASRADSIGLIYEVHKIRFGMIPCIKL